MGDNLSQRFLSDERDGSIICRVADDQDEKRTVAGWPAEHLIKETHGAWRVRERRETGVVKSCYEQASGDTYRLLPVVVLDFLPVRTPPIELAEDRDQVWRRLQERLELVSPERGDRLEPLVLGAPVIKGSLFGLRALPNSRLKGWVRHDDEVPRLPVRTTRGGVRRSEAVVDDLGRHGSLGKVAHGTTFPRAGIELSGAALHLGFGVALVARKGNERRLGHRSSLWLKLA